MKLFGLRVGGAEEVDTEELLEDAIDPEEDEQRHKHYVATFLFLKANLQDRIAALTDHLADEKLNTRQWAAAFREELTAGHSEAWLIGRRLAGDVQAIGQRDLTGGAEAWARQEEFFAGFLADLENGRYTEADGSLKEKAFDARAKQYGEAIRGTAHDAFKTAMGTETLAWVLGAKDHCKPDPAFPFYCVGLSQESPKPANDWKTSPGLGDTPCRGYCSCGFESEDGRFSTRGI